ncbi:KTSC domain-containing protein [bacterium]|nr:KTSC domain-containing protein [bacterium]
MTRTPVVSSNLKSVGYDTATRTLEIQFLSGGIYQYINVPPNVYSALMAASSHGSFFARAIRNSYRFRKIN